VPEIKSQFISGHQLVTGELESPPGNAPDADPVILEDFSSVRTQAMFENPETPAKKIWFGFGDGFGTNNGASNITITTPGLLEAVLGSPEATASKHQMYTRTLDNFGWYHIRRFQESPTYTGPSSYTNGVRNRLRFFFKNSLNYSPGFSGQHNIEWATFLHNFRSTDDFMAGSDENNWHFYHYLDCDADNLFWHVVIDTAPNHERGVSGASPGDIKFPDPSGSNSAANIGKTYFDLMTAWYFDYVNNAANPGTVYFKDYISLFTENDSSDVVNRCKAITGTYNPSNDQFKLIWQRGYGMNSAVHDVAWAYTPITDWDEATSVGTATGGTENGETSMRKNFTLTPTQRYVHIGIRPQVGDGTWRRFWIDTEMND
jgi:hypothetical protein